MKKIIIIVALSFFANAIVTAQLKTSSGNLRPAGYTQKVQILNELKNANFLELHPEVNIEFLNDYQTQIDGIPFVIKKGDKSAVGEVEVITTRAGKKAIVGCVDNQGTLIQRVATHKKYPNGSFVTIPVFANITLDLLNPILTLNLTKSSQRNEVNLATNEGVTVYKSPDTNLIHNMYSIEMPVQFGRVKISFFKNMDIGR